MELYMQQQMRWNFFIAGVFIFMAASSSSILASPEYLKENSMREGVVVLPSGLQYEIMVEGSGAKPGPRDVVTTHYHGTLIDGSVFDSSVERRAPASFPLDRVISGWTEGLQLMSVGSKWKFFIPPNLAYGDRRIPGIPANSTLIFEVELLDIE
ncbi:MAG: peptidylprolyl isomerase [Gammaproteobacteria bacterium]|nr:peptidylprolyl isomerase [Gammaproteobacteria bacterium]|tara:strand:+ start:68 stop:529 length:462 start_codon:yes stop_codon:yes gene_type:complete